MQALVITDQNELLKLTVNGLKTQLDVHQKFFKDPILTSKEF